MSQDNVLKKEFKKHDVQRLRNVLTGKAGERTTEGVGYTKAKEFYKEGDVWTEMGREWTIKDGLKQNLTKLDRAKSLAMPMFCPSCSKVMNHAHDKLFWATKRYCRNCQIEFETDLKINGQSQDISKNAYTQYEISVNNEAIDKTKQDYKDWVEEMLNTNNTSFVTEAGDVENWKGGVNKKLAQKSMDEAFEALDKMKINPKL